MLKTYLIKLKKILVKILNIRIQKNEDCLYKKDKSK